MAKSFVLIEDHETMKAGTQLFSFRFYDYGCSLDDFALTGIEHLALTLKADGDYPFQTVPINKLASVELVPVETI